MATTTKEMTEGAPLPLILNFTFPLLLGNILQQTYSLVDAAIVGKFLGINDLAAIGASTSVVFLILGFCNGCCCGFGIPVAQYTLVRTAMTIDIRAALYPALHHTRRRIHQSGDAFRSFRNDRTHTGQYLCRTDIRILSCLLWRSDRLDSSRPLPRPGIHICLSETEKEP